MIVFFAATAGAAAGIAPVAGGALAAPASIGSGRDVVLDAPSAASARISATATATRYSIGDDSDDTIAVAVTDACRAACNAADPQRIASFVGTLAHGFEVNLLTVQLDTPLQLDFDCGIGALACYYSGQNRIVISGDDTIAPDGASREFILAHEYGHHVARHRDSPPPFPPAIAWGTARWASQERVCQAHRAGLLFPGNQATHYFQDPGEAFAESFAYTRFPEAEVRWRWTPRLRPTPASLRAIREDTLAPWASRSAFTLTGRFPKGGGAPGAETFSTPLDGLVSLRPSATGRRGLEVSLRNSAGHVLRTFRQRLGQRERLDYTVCGQSQLRVVVRPKRPTEGTFQLRIQRP